MFRWVVAILTKIYTGLPPAVLFLSNLINPASLSYGSLNVTGLKYWIRRLNISAT